MGNGEERMNNSDFFQNALGAKLKNSRWSWGAKSTDTKRIFLRVWKKDIPDSGDRVRIDLTGAFCTKWKEREST